jgi:hypothetical protein
MSSLPIEQAVNLKQIIKEQIDTNPIFATLKEKLKSEIDSQNMDKDLIIAKI